MDFLNCGNICIHIYMLYVERAHQRLHNIMFKNVWTRENAVNGNQHMRKIKHIQEAAFFVQTFETNRYIRMYIIYHILYAWACDGRENTLAYRKVEFKIFALIIYKWYFDFRIIANRWPVNFWLIFHSVYLLNLYKDCRDIIHYIGHFNDIFFLCVAFNRIGIDIERSINGAYQTIFIRTVLYMYINFNQCRFTSFA